MMIFTEGFTAPHTAGATADGDSVGGIRCSSSGGVMVVRCGRSSLRSSSVKTVTQRGETAAWHGVTVLDLLNLVKCKSTTVDSKII